jgi:diguanylate cyclase (GGDEF)-like protein
VAATAITCLAASTMRQSARAGAAFSKRLEEATRRLFEHGGRAGDVREAGAVLARVAAELFDTERAGVLVVDSDGVIAYAAGVGVTSEVNNALSASLVGKIASESPVWRALERVTGPSLVEDATRSVIRPGGFVQSMSLISYVAIPLLSTSGLLGVAICGESSRRRAWTPKEGDLARQFALEGALIIEAARLRATERAQLAHITHLAFHDGLTGVPNRRLLMDRLEDALASATRNQTKVALLLLDLNGFKQVNDSLGHECGDALLREVAQRLRSSQSAEDTIARLGGDEFAILLSGDSSVEKAQAAAASVEAVLSTPVNLNRIPVDAIASIGIALCPDHATTPADLMQRADIAMYAAKRSRSGPVVYHPLPGESAVDNLALDRTTRH